MFLVWKVRYEAVFTSRIFAIILNVQKELRVCCSPGELFEDELSFWTTPGRVILWASSLFGRVARSPFRQLEMKIDRFRNRHYVLLLEQRKNGGIRNHAGGSFIGESLISDSLGWFLIPCCAELRS